MSALIGIAVLVVCFGPLVLGATAWVRARSSGVHFSPSTWNWRLTLSSMLVYTLAFNVTFLVQEFFLVLPKSFLPGVHVTLFHNNHRWTGEHPLTLLFQGTGALATFIMGLVCLAVVRVRPIRSRTLRLLLIWIAYSGIFMALPQVANGALIPQSDLGMAMAFLHLGPMSKTLAAVLAVAGMPLAALLLVQPLLGLAQQQDQVDTPRGRARFVFQVATLPTLLAIPLIVAYRVPREIVEVLVPPIIVSVIGVAWIQATAPFVRDAAVHPGTAISVTRPLVAAVALLLVFQCVLRPGIEF